MAIFDPDERLPSSATLLSSVSSVRTCSIQSEYLLVQSHLSSFSSVKGHKLGKAYPRVATGYIVAAPPTAVQKHPETLKRIKFPKPTAQR